MSPTKVKKAEQDVNTNFPISRILVKENIRDKGWDARVDELAASIKKVGLLSPVLLMPLTKPIEGKTHELVFGFRRLAAHKALKFSTIKVNFAPKGMTRKQKDTARLVENTDREDLSPIEEAQAYDAMMLVHKLNAKEVAQLVSKTDGHISQRLALLRMPEKVLAAVECGDITATHARQLHRIKDAGEQEKLVKKASEMTAKSFEDYVEQKLHPEKKPKKDAKAPRASTNEYQSRKVALQAMTKLDLARAKAKEEGNKERMAHLSGVMRGLTWALKLSKSVKLPL